MLKYIIGRMFYGLVAVFLAASFVFFLCRKAPGGPFDRDKPLPPDVKAMYEKQFGLDLPMSKQYIRFLRKAVQGDFGPSIIMPEKQVIDIIKERLPITITVGVVSMFGVALVIGILSGIIAALRHNKRLDHLIVGGTMIGIAIPDFTTGTLLIYFFCMEHRVFPRQGWGTLLHMVLPVTVMSLYYITTFTRYTRGGMLEVLREEYIVAARAKGLPMWKVVVRHALWGGLRPLLSYLGIAVPFLFGGSTLLVEQMFNLEGIGEYFITAIRDRDYTMIMGIVVMFSVVLSAFTIVIDISYTLIDPRQRRRST